MKGELSRCVLISVRPQWCEKIANGEKTLEIRKSRPKQETPFKCYIYCTAPKKFHMISEHMATSTEYLHLCDGKVTMSDGFEFFGREDYEVLNRKVIGEFVCDWILSIYPPFGNKTDGTCLSAPEMYQYAENKMLYGWHISALQIYDKPGELSEFGISRAPQSWCYVEPTSKDEAGGGAE